VDIPNSLHDSGSVFTGQAVPQAPPQLTFFLSSPPFIFSRGGVASLPSRSSALLPFLIESLVAKNSSLIFPPPFFFLRLLVVSPPYL